MQIRTLPIKTERQVINFAPDDSRVITKSFIPNKKRIQKIIERINALPESEVEYLLAENLKNFAHRHENLKRKYKDQYDKVIQIVKFDKDLSLDRRLLIGSYFTMEYSIESAALFNPSIVPDFDQTATQKGDLKVILSFRAVGEGHISSIVFRTGIINKNGDFNLEPKNFIVEKGIIVPKSKTDKEICIMKLQEMNAVEIMRPILDELLDKFTEEELEKSIQRYSRKKKNTFDSSEQQAIDLLRWVSRSTFELEYDSELTISGKVIFPISQNQMRGLEDARFVYFNNGDDTPRYYATYSAFNGHIALPQLIETKDFQHFKISILSGNGVQDKGMALFPKKINGKYAVISRNDNENLYIMFSEHIYHWKDPIKIKEPEFPWEFYQVGNCGSPIETDKGWLLITHGVGNTRTYSIGAILLDYEDPSKVIATSEHPLLVPQENERNGYVPNVVYSCGSLIHNNKLILPYAMSDTRSGIAKFDVDEILSALKPK